MIRNLENNPRVSFGANLGSRLQKVVGNGETYKYAEESLQQIKNLAPGKTFELVNLPSVGDVLILDGQLMKNQLILNSSCSSFLKHLADILKAELSGTTAKASHFTTRAVGNVLQNRLENIIK